MVNGIHYLAAALLSLTMAANAETARQFVQQVVNEERAANAADHSQWIYLENKRQPNEHVVEWVASTAHGDVRRVLQRNDREMSDQEQRADIQKFLHDATAQNKDVAAYKHDMQQVDDLLKLLPEAFLWTKTGESGSSTTLHFEPDPHFRPPTREARVLAGMAGDLVADNQQHRIRRMSGHLNHDVTFGAGLLGRLKQVSSFSLEQEDVGRGIWELTAIRVHLQGNAFLFHSVSLEQDDERSSFRPEPDAVTLDQAAAAVMHQPLEPGAMHAQ